MVRLQKRADILGGLANRIRLLFLKRASNTNTKI